MCIYIYIFYLYLLIMYIYIYIHIFTCAGFFIQHVVYIRSIRNHICIYVCICICNIYIYMYVYTITLKNCCLETLAGISGQPRGGDAKPSWTFWDGLPTSGSTAGSSRTQRSFAWWISWRISAITAFCGVTCCYCQIPWELESSWQCDRAWTSWFSWWCCIKESGCWSSWWSRDSGCWS